MSSKVPDHVRELLISRVDSFEKLEMILALRKMERGACSVESLALSLGLAPEAARDAARELKSALLVDLSSKGDVQLLPRSIHDDAAIEALVRAYDDDSFAVIREMGEIAMGRIRNMAAEVFADAFLIRKKPPKNGNRG